MTNYAFGIEEEYFVIDSRTRNVRQKMPQEFFRACQADLGNQVTSELLQAQIEVTSVPCSQVDEARQELARFRTTLANRASQYGLGIIAAGTHPLAVWREQKQTPKNRYNDVMHDVQMIGLRNMLCGMHVHVEVPDPARRIELMYRTIPFLHLFLALSTSSPFWQGRRTGLAGYRLAAHEEMPRTGLPELFKTTAEYELYVQTLTASAVIRDPSFIWWSIRPSNWHPTLELRIADVCTHIQDALCIAAMYRCLIRHLATHPELNATIEVVDRGIAAENKWRAQRLGTGASFVRRGSSCTEPLEKAIADIITLLHDDAEALSCVEEIRHASEIVRRGSSAHQQLRVYETARHRGQSRTQALKAVVDWLGQASVSVAGDANSAMPMTSADAAETCRPMPG
jgi:carboxylate-amine ligase